MVLMARKKDGERPEQPKSMDEQADVVKAAAADMLKGQAEIRNEMKRIMQKDTVPVQDAAEVVVGEPVSAELVRAPVVVRLVPHVEVPAHSPGPWFVSPEGIRDANKRVIIAHSFAKTPGDLAAAALVPALEEEIRQLREEIKLLVE